MPTQPGSPPDPFYRGPVGGQSPAVGLGGQPVGPVPPLPGQGQYGQYGQYGGQYGQSQYGQSTRVPTQPIPPPPGPSVEPRRDQAWYGIGFLAAVRRAFQKYADFSSYASRGEYWWFYLANTLVAGGLITASWLAGGRDFWIATLLRYGSGGAYSGSAPSLSGMGAGAVFYVLLWLWAIAALIPNLALVWRRLHDAGHSGAWFFVSVVPFGGIILLVFLLQPGTPPGDGRRRPHQSRL
jgi:uncharacterized membrane protein YhaH (DUF805 family)